MYESFGIDSPPSMEIIFNSCHSLKCSEVNVRTLHCWWDTYLEWGELPFYVKKRKKDMKGYGRNMHINERELLKLKLIVDKHTKY